MNEVEKMYSNVGLSNMWVERYNDGYYEHERYYNSYKEMINNMMKANDWTLTEAQEVAKRECKKEHPPFTAEKQLLLIQWLAETRPIHINFSFDKWTIEGMVRYGIKYDTFKDALSGYINQIWQDLTEEERKQIKNILEG